MECNFAFTLISEATIVADMYTRKCSAMINNVTVGGAAVTNAEKWFECCNTHIDHFVTTPYLNVSFTAKEKNAKTVTKTFCAHTDILDNLSGEVMCLL